MIQNPRNREIGDVLRRLSPVHGRSRVQREVQPLGGPDRKGQRNVQTVGIAVRFAGWD